jgi:ArsR family transcriptional regulator
MAADEEKRLKFKAKVFKVFSDPTRLRILELLRGKERNVSEMMQELGLKQSTVSQHLRMLNECGVVCNKKEGREVYYSIADGVIGEMLDLGDKVLVFTVEDMASCVCK